MDRGQSPVQVSLRRESFGEKERVAVEATGLSASLFRYDTGIEAVRLTNSRGNVVVLPYLGQMVWSANFHGVDLAMRSMFTAPRPAKSIVETYGCLAYHCGMLRVGVPGPEDNHALHGEAPCAEMDEAGIACGVDEKGAWIAVTGKREYAMGFGSHYLATPRVAIRPDETALDFVMEVENLSTADMDLMYLCHANFAFAEGARVVQPVPFTPDKVVARTAIPGHIPETPQYRARINEFAAHPERMSTLGEPSLYDPEQVFYVKGLKRGVDGLVHFMLLRREGDAFTVAYDPESMPHLIRWILVNADQGVAGFALPATCEPEGYTAEKRKGNVRTLAGKAKARFATRLGYVDKAHAAAAARNIEGK